MNNSRDIEPGTTPLDSDIDPDGLMAMCDTCQELTDYCTCPAPGVLTVEGAVWQCATLEGVVIVPAVSTNNVESRVSLSREPLEDGMYSLMVEDAEGMALPVILTPAALRALIAGVSL